MKRLFFFLLLLASMLLLTSCWDRIELNDLTIVTGVGIDRIDENTVEVTASIMVPKALGSGESSAAGGGAKPSTIRNGVGNTLADAITNLQEKLSRQLFWGHTKIIVVDERLAKAGIREDLDFFTRFFSTRLNTYILVSKGKAKDVMALSPPIESGISEVLRELVKSQILMSTTLKDVLQMLSGDAEAVAIPMISILPPVEGQKQLETIAYIKETAIFKKDRMIGSMADHPTRGLLWFRNEIKQANMTVKLEKGNGFVSTTLIQAHTELIPKITDGKWKIIVKAETDQDIIINKTNMSMMDPKVVPMIEKRLEADIKARMKIALEKVQKEMKADVLGFSEVFHRGYPEEWKKAKDHWNEIFPTVDVEYQIKVYVRRPGLTTSPQGLPSKEVKKP